MIQKRGIGGWLIVLSAFLFIVALFMPWIDLFIVSLSGFERKAYWLLFLFIYPLYTVIWSKPLNIIFGLLASLIMVSFMIYFIVMVPTNLMGHTVHAIGYGLYIGLAAAILFVIGSFLKGIDGK